MVRASRAPAVSHPDGRPGNTRSNEESLGRALRQRALLHVEQKRDAPRKRLQ